MIAIISGTNRPGSCTRRVAAIVESMVQEAQGRPKVLDLALLPPAIFDPRCYAEKPAAFAPFQRTILEAHGILVVIPEYNGSFPGVMKYFLDMLEFPKSLQGVPCGFIGLGAGEWGCLRGVEQLEMIFQYRHAHLYGKRVFLKRIQGLLDAEGRLIDEDMLARLADMVQGFIGFCGTLRAGAPV